jgi:hypothetical protein
MDEGFQRCRVLVKVVESSDHEIKEFRDGSFFLNHCKDEPSEIGGETQFIVIAAESSIRREESDGAHGVEIAFTRLSPLDFCEVKEIEKTRSGVIGLVDTPSGKAHETRRFRKHDSYDSVFTQRISF